MAKEKKSAGVLRDLLQRHSDELYADWMRELSASPTMRSGLISESELREQAREFLRLLQKGASAGPTIEGPEWDEMKDLLTQISRSRALQGFSPSETATFVFSFKQPMFALLRDEGSDKEQILELVWSASILIDNLGLYTTEVYQRNREEVIKRQQHELLELSTPVVKLWDGVLAVPLIGTLDSARTQIVMENLLQSIVDHSASVAIIDITGVPTVDTLVAQHLIKTVAAARLMGAECIISGIRAQIAQTIVHLGISLENVTTKATLADAITTALRMVGLTLSKPGRAQQQA